MARSEGFRRGRSAVETTCPLDCPDSCSLTVSLADGRIAKIDGSTRNPLTSGFICAKVRRFGDRVYAPERIQTPLVRNGPKGSGSFAPASWETALDRIVQAMEEVRTEWGGEAILPFSYGGSNGLLTQDTTDAELFRRLGASRLARTVCAAPTGAAAAAMYGRMAGVDLQDYADAGLIVIWGCNPSTSGIHLVPIVRAAQRAGARLVVIDPRRTKLAASADVHVACRPGSDLAIALSLHRHLFERGLADQEFLDAHTTGAAELRAAAEPWTFERAADVSGAPIAQIEALASLYAETDPAVIRLGWGVERNRNGGHAALAILGLPAVAGKFGKRAGGYTMSNSAVWGLSPDRWVEAPVPATREVNMNRLGEVLEHTAPPPVKLLFVYNCNPAVTMPDQNRVFRGLGREDLFTVVFDQVMTDTTAFADVVLPATTFLEHYDIARGYGSMTLGLIRPVIDTVGDSRPNGTVFAELARRLGLLDAPPEDDAQLLIQVSAAMPPETASPLLADQLPEPPCGRRPVQFVDVFPGTSDRRAHLFPDVATAAPDGLYSFQADPATPAHPLSLISPASPRTISSTLGELVARPARLSLHPQDASARGITDGDDVRVFNDLGEVQCVARVTGEMRPGVVSLPKGLWRHRTANRSTATALVPATLTDLGGGACFNDARVEVARVLEVEFASRSIALWVKTDQEGGTD